jgi:hypothetical protein
LWINDAAATNDDVDNDDDNDGDNDDDVDDFDAAAAALHTYSLHFGKCRIKHLTQNLQEMLHRRQ